MWDMEKLEGTEYLTPNEVAEARGANLNTVLKALRAGRLRGRKALGRWLILPADAEQWEPGTWGDAKRMKKEKETE